MSRRPRRMQRGTDRDPHNSNIRKDDDDDGDDGDNGYVDDYDQAMDAADNSADRRLHTRRRGRAARPAPLDPQVVSDNTYGDDNDVVPLSASTTATASSLASRDAFTSAGRRRRTARRTPAPADADLHHNLDDPYADQEPETMYDNHAMAQQDDTYDSPISQSSRRSRRRNRNRGTDSPKSPLLENQPEDAEENDDGFSEAGTPAGQGTGLGDSSTVGGEGTRTSRLTRSSRRRRRTRFNTDAPAQDDDDDDGTGVGGLPHHDEADRDQETTADQQSGLFLNGGGGGGNDGEEGGGGTGVGEAGAAAAQQRQQLLADQEGTGAAKSKTTVVFEAPIVIPHDEQVRRENETLWRVSNKEMRHDEESGLRLQPRTLQEEGFFVADKPMSAPWNEYRFEQILYRSGVQWFGDDGRIEREDDPLKEVVNRPLAELNLDKRAKHLMVSFRPASKGTANVNTDTAYQLDVDIAAIRFVDHPLFIEEEYLASQLIAMNRKYLQLISEDNERYYSEQLDVLKEQLRIESEDVGDGDAQDDSTGGDVAGAAAAANAASGFASLLAGNAKANAKAKGKGKLSQLAKAASGLSGAGLAQRTQSGSFADNVKRMNRRLREREARMNAVKKDIRLTRQLKDAAEFSVRDLVMQMLRVWNRIKRLRDSQGFVSTRVRLKVKIIETNAEEDERRWMQQLHDELEELREQHDKDHADANRKWQMEYDMIQNVQEQYEVAYREWEARQARRERALERREQRRLARQTRADDDDETGLDSSMGLRRGAGGRRRASRRGVDNDTDASLQDETLGDDELDMDDMEEPPAEPDTEAALDRLGDRPQKEEFAEEEHSQDIWARFEATKRGIGAPIYVPILSDSQAVTSNDELQQAGIADEKARRALVGKYKLQAKLFVNGKLVFKSNTASLSFPSYEIDVGQIFPVHVRTYPSSIMIELVQPGVITDTVVARIPIDVPSSESAGVDHESHEAATYEFEGLEEIRDVHNIRAKNSDLTHTSAAGVGSASSGEQPPQQQLGEGRTGDDADGSAGVAASLRMVRGELFARASWQPISENQPAEQPLAPEQPKHRLDALMEKRVVRSKYEDMKIAQLRAFLKAGKKDPNDPRVKDFRDVVNAQELSANETAVFSLQRSKRATLLDPYAPIEDGPSDGGSSSSSSSDSKRIQALKLRSKYGLELRVPMLEEEVDLRVFHEHVPEQETEGADQTTRGGRKRSARQRAGARRRRYGAGKPVKSNAWLKRIHNSDLVRQLQRARETHAVSMHVNQVVNEVPLPDFNTPFTLFESLFQQRRKLKPQRKERKAVVSSQERRLIIKLLRGYNLPARNGGFGVAGQTRDVMRGGSGGGRRRRGGAAGRQSVFDAPGAGEGVGGSGQGYAGMNGEDEDEGDGERLAPVVEVRFQGNETRSFVSRGTDPEWNTSFDLPFNPGPGGFDPSYLSTLSEMIEFKVYDHRKYDLPHDDRRRSERLQRELDIFLGQLDIPFSTVYQNSRVEGSFFLNAPPVILKYRKAEDVGGGAGGGGGGASSSSSQQQRPAGSMDPMLSVLITIEPPLVIDNADDVLFDGEEEDFLRYAEKWEAGLRKRKACAGRVIQATAADMEGNSTFICRYVRPQKPPDLLENDPKRMVRFVSLIPFLEDAAAFIGRFNLWSTTEEFLAMNVGDWEEHAVLLCNYLLYLNVEAYVVLGSAIPEGDTAYVLVREGNNWRYINAVTGHMFEHMDANCPLFNVGVIFNEDNIWANVQEHGEPSQLSYDLSDTKQWVPFYTPKFEKRNLPSKQDEVPRYKGLEDVRRLRSDIVSTLTWEIESNWRLGMDDTAARVTNWNSLASKDLEKVLEQMETSKWNSIPFTEDAHDAIIDSVQRDYDLIGYPINVTMTDMEDIVDAVFATKIWDMDDGTAEFALGVHVVAYPNRVTSVWVYLVALLPKPFRF